MLEVVHISERQEFMIKIGQNVWVKWASFRFKSIYWPCLIFSVALFQRITFKERKIQQKLLAILGLNSLSIPLKSSEIGFTFFFPFLICRNYKIKCNLTLLMFCCKSSCFVHTYDLGKKSKAQCYIELNTVCNLAYWFL